MYTVPPAHVIDAFAIEACSLLGADEPDIASGFAGFLKAVAQAQANNMNREGSKPIDEEVQAENNLAG